MAAVSVQVVLKRGELIVGERPGKISIGSDQRRRLLVQPVELGEMADIQLLGLTGTPVVAVLENPP
ncbi:hypothetical protein H9654_03340 [Stenotrophomonas sp. Sa5BUN4]|uniref:Uncharacterized protein n=1 Tax=Stenotrophomonas lacuserhaii TaxID=2760084 RepID=A0A8X8FUR1_9GAMM|nr:hypothetical protein [Stenotrophomonas pennii]MBD7953232.1 hypothetical protein [Stenotrophomonas pennii]